MLQPRNRPVYVRARSVDEPSLEQDNIELPHMYHNDSYDDQESWNPRPASIQSDTATYEAYDQSRRRQSATTENTDLQNNDVRHLLVSSQSSHPSEAIVQRRRSKLISLPGWRRATLIASCIAIVSLIINIVAAIWLSRHPYSSGLVELSEGQCKEIQRSDTLIHLAINIVGTLLLSGSNYCMQCLSAPTRKELDVAHHRGKYLDIGVPGIRNLTSIARYRLFLWLALLLSSVPLHLLYNSAIYSSLAMYDYKIMVVTNAFLNDTVQQSQYLGVNSDLSRYQQLTPSKCITKYAQVFLADRSDLVIVSSTTSNNSVLNQTFNAYNVSGLDAMYYRPYEWICTSDPDIQSKIVVPIDESNGEPLPCEDYVSKIIGIANDWAPFGHPIEYCLSLPMEEKCRLNGDIPIVVIVIVCNAVKAAIVLFITLYPLNDPLLTVGDAVASFLQEPDPTTRGLCLLSRLQVKSAIDQLTDRAYMWPARKTEPPIPQMAWIPSYTYFGAASKVRWAWTIFLFIVSCVMVAGMLGFAIVTVSGQGVTIWGLGFGTVHTQAIISGWSIDWISSPSQQILNAILIANTPQTILSFMYFSFNGLFTAIWLASEWNDFDKDRKPLRTSTPNGQQRSTYFLQLPYKVGIPLLILSALLHWLVSQSIFLAVVSEWDSEGTLINPVAIASCGYSPMAMIFVLVLAALIATMTFFVARQKVNSTMRIAGSCSAAISAACHPPSWDVDAAEKPVMWGVTHQVAGMDDVGHCSFSSGTVSSLQRWKDYM